MPSITLSAEDLLAGANTTYNLEIPPEILKPSMDAEQDKASSNGSEVVVQIKPITLGAFQLITKAAKDDTSLIPLLMIQEACVQPQLSINQVKSMHMGLVEFLVKHIRTISGLTGKKNSPME